MQSHLFTLFIELNLKVSWLLEAIKNGSVSHGVHGGHGGWIDPFNLIRRFQTVSLVLKAVQPHRVHRALRARLSPLP